MKIKTIFFDFDGVIAESVNVKTEVFYQMYLPYGEEIAQKVKRHHLDNGGMSRFVKFRLYHKEFLNIELSDEGLAKLTQQFSNSVMQGVINAPLVSGILDFLKENYQKLNFFVITGTPTDEIREILKARNLEIYFEGAFGSPEKKDFWVQKIITENQYSTSESIFIGDAFADYDAANNNNIPFILREWEENIELFQNIECYRIKNFQNFNQFLDSLQ